MSDDKPADELEPEPEKITWIHLYMLLGVMVAIVIIVYICAAACVEIKS